MDELMLIDGYNVIGIWPHLRRLRQKQLSYARELLIATVVNYCGYTGIKCIVVFDAHQVDAPAYTAVESDVEVHYTNRHETADAFIERYVRLNASVYRSIYVVTSDQQEQLLTFGSGALRMPALELLEEVQRCERKTEEYVYRNQGVLKNTLGNRISPEQLQQLQKIRKQK